MSELVTLEVEYDTRWARRWIRLMEFFWPVLSRLLGRRRFSRLTVGVGKRLVRYRIAAPAKFATRCWSRLDS